MINQSNVGELPNSSAVTLGPTLVWAGKKPSLAISLPPVRLVESHRFPFAAWNRGLLSGDEWLAFEPGGGLLFQGDNLDFLAYLGANGFRGRVNLIYVDPPFRSGADYGREILLRGPLSGSRSLGRWFQYADVWAPEHYLQFIYERLLALRELLAEGGSIFMHCDHRASHQIRCLLDELLGAESFRNEIVWAYSAGARGAKATARQFGRNHDVILWYQKGRSVPRLKTESESNGGASYRPVFAQRRVPLGEARRAGYQQDAGGRWFKTAPRGDYTEESIASLEKEGRIYRTRSGSVRIKYYLLQEGADIVEDVMLGDVWSDIPDAMHLPVGERTGFSTQKPLALLERIIAACSNAGDLVLDCFGGAGTTAVAAHKLGRRWVCGDVSGSAVAITRQRLLRLEDSARFAVYHVGEDLAASPSSSFPEGEGKPAVPRDRSFDLSDNAPARRASLDMRRENGKLVVEISRFTSPAIVECLRKEGIDESTIDDWRVMVDNVAIDVAFNGDVFDITLADAPARRADLVVGKYLLEAPPGVTVAVKICDVLGEEIVIMGEAP